MKNTDEVKREVQAKVSEIMTLLQQNGYDQADVEISASPVAYSGNRYLNVWDEFDWKPSEDWQGSNC